MRQDSRVSAWAVQGPVRILLDLVEGTVGHDAEQRAGVLVAYGALFHDVKEGLDGA